ncbi:MAG: cation transporter, partial [Candidatus Omnitrophica bacterium]|nr:cation transporter [Candidatus Omnitrophota bacterium]
MKKDKVIIGIVGMHCSNCALSIEAALKRAKGVLQAKVNFAAENAFIEYDSELTGIDALHKIITDSGYRTIKQEPGAPVDAEKQIREAEIKSLKTKFIFSLALSLPLMYFSMGRNLGLPVPRIVADNMAFAQLALATPVLFFGRQFFTRG